MIFFSPLVYKYAQQGRKLASPGAGRQPAQLPRLRSTSCESQSCPFELLGFLVPHLHTAPGFAANCFPLPPVEQTNFRPYNSSAQEPTDWKRRGKRRGSPPLSFKFKLEVLGIEVMDANVAVLTPAAVTVQEEKQDKVTNVVRSSQCRGLYQYWSLFSRPPLKTNKGVAGQKTVSVTQPKRATGRK